MSDGIDWDTFITPAPPRGPSGRSMLMSTFEALAKRKAEMQKLAAEQAHDRWVQNLQAEGRANALTETSRSNIASEEQRRLAGEEAARHNQAGEANAEADNERQMTEFHTKLLADPQFREDMQGQDPQVIDTWGPALDRAGLTLETARAALAREDAARPEATPPGLLPVDDLTAEATTEALGTYEAPPEPSADSRQLSGPGVSMGFDPAANARMALARAQRVGDQFEAGADTMGEHSATGVREGAQMLRGSVAAGVDPAKAITGAMGFATSSAGRGQSAENAARAGARATTVKPGQKIDDDRALANSAAGLLGTELAREDYRETIKTARDNALMIKLLESNNPAAHKRAMGIAAKQGSGPGAVTNEERDYFVNSVGGKDESLKALALTWLAGGEVPEQQRKIFAASYKNILMRHNEEVLSGIRANVRDTFASHPNTEFQKYADWAEKRVAPSILGAPKKPAAGAAPASDAAADALLGKYK